MLTMDQLNIKELATATYNKEPMMLFKMIKDYLNGIGVEPTNEKIKSIFDDVTKEHFTISSQEKANTTSIVSLEQQGSQATQLANILPSTSQSQYSNTRNRKELLTQL